MKLGSAKEIYICANFNILGIIYGLVSKFSYHDSEFL